MFHLYLVVSHSKIMIIHYPARVTVHQPPVDSQIWRSSLDPLSGVDRSSQSVNISPWTRKNSSKMQRLRRTTSMMPTASSRSYGTSYASTRTVWLSLLVTRPNHHPPTRPRLRRSEKSCDASWPKSGWRSTWTPGASTRTKSAAIHRSGGCLQTGILLRWMWRRGRGQCRAILPSPGVWTAQVAAGNHRIPGIPRPLSALRCAQQRRTAQFSTQRPNGTAVA